MIRKQKIRRNNEVALAMLILFMGTVSCSTESSEPVPSSVELQLTSTINVQQTTRSYTGDPSNGTQSTNILAGQTIWAWANYSSTAVHATPNSEYFTAWQLVAGGTGSLSGSAHYYPPNMDPFDITAVQGNFTESISENSNTSLPVTLTHTILSNQASAANYAKSDLLWAQKQKMTVSGRTGTTEVLNFAHLLSKVEITLVPGSQTYGDVTIAYTTDDLKDAIVDIMNVMTDVTLTMADGTTATGTTMGNVRIKETTDNSVGFTPSGSTAYSWVEAILPPQTLACTTAFIRVKLPQHGNRTLYYQIPDDPATGLVLEANTRYRFVFTVTPTVIKLSGLYYQSGFDDETVAVIPEA